MSPERSRSPFATEGVTKLAIAVTFFFREERLNYLAAISAEFDDLASAVIVHVMTNSGDAADQDRIRSALGDHRFHLNIHTPTLIGHDYLLTWAHFTPFRTCLRDDPSISHFLYVEDDICITPRNFAYWLQGRARLRPYGLIPSFLRFERKADGTGPYATDVTASVDIATLPAAAVSADACFLNLPQPYQGMYLLDRELMSEHLAGPSFNPDFGAYGIRERAAQGLTFVGIPKGCFSRNFIGYDLARGKIDPDCLIHHMPNNYANDPASPFAKILVQDVVALPARVPGEPIPTETLA